MHCQISATISTDKTRGHKTIQESSGIEADCHPGTVKTKQINVTLLLSTKEVNHYLVRSFRLVQRQSIQKSKDETLSSAGKSNTEPVRIPSSDGMDRAVLSMDMFRSVGNKNGN